MTRQEEASSAGATGTVGSKSTELKRILSAWIRTPILFLGLCAMAGLAFGVVDRLAEYVPGIAIPVTSLAGPWIILAFSVGVVGPNKVLGIIAGGLTLLFGIIGYYGYMYLGQGLASPLYLGRRLPIWLFIGAVVGIVFGYMGRVWRSRAGVVRVLAASALCGLVAGEAVIGLTTALERHWPKMNIYPWELLVAAAMPLLLVRGWRLRSYCYVATAAVATLTTSALPVLSNLM